MNLKKSRAGALADKEGWVQVPLCNQRKPLIRLDSWERGDTFVWTETHSGEMCACLIAGCTLRMLLTALWAPVRFSPVLQFCPLCFAHLEQHTCSVSSFHVLSEWNRIFVQKRRKTSLRFCCRLNFRIRSSTPKSSWWIPNLEWWKVQACYIRTWCHSY